LKQGPAAKAGPNTTEEDCKQMSNEISIINLGELSKPAKVLIEKISDAVGGVCKPYQIVRVAKAEAEAERIRAESQIQVSDLQRRALHRFLEEEANKQRNIENITCEALPQLNDDSQPEKIENDWIANFFDKCRLISDAEMQTLWSRVLAGEANAPGSYSKRTVNFLSSLDKTDAELFTQLCTFGWVMGDFALFIYDLADDIYKKHGITFNSLLHLENIGLVKSENVFAYSKLELPKMVTVFYYGRPVDLEFGKEHSNQIRVGITLLTQIGEQLAPICGSQPDPDFYEYTLTKWKALGYIKERKTEQPAIMANPES
jgi:hypothetical protein